MSLHVSLTPELEELVHERVASGMYGSASELVRDALRQMFTPDEWTVLDQEVEPRLARLLDGTVDVVSLASFKESGEALLSSLGDV